MTVYKNHNQIEPSRVIVDGIHVKKYQKEPPPLGAIHSEYGLNIFKKNIINRIDEKVFPISRYFDILAAKEELLAYPINKRFYEIGCPEGIADLEKLLKNK